MLGSDEVGYSVAERVVGGEGGKRTVERGIGRGRGTEGGRVGQKPEERDKGR